MSRDTITLDGNQAVASVAYRCNETIAIYPITPSSPMAEYCDEWASQGHRNVWGQVPEIVEMQSEGGAAGVVHGALQAGALSTSFTSSQGLLLKIPNLYKIAGELTPFCLHVAARTVATHALSIFGDHSDVMACRQTGMAQLCSNSVQEAHDFALIGQAATLESRIPFMHFFDGFRTSHEVNQITPVSDDEICAMLSDEAIQAHRQRALTPDKPVIRGTAQNPDVFFQAREACNPYYEVCPETVADLMARFAQLTGRRYQLFEYEGHPAPSSLIIAMGSACETISETLNWMDGEHADIGLLKVRLFRPFSLSHFADAIPTSVQRIVVLDRTKEPGAIAEPLYQDVVTACNEAVAVGRMARMPRIIGGRYGLSSKEFCPTCVMAVIDNLMSPAPRNRFTVGINDDISHLSLPLGETLHVERETRVNALFYGLGSDGTVSANKNTIKIVGEHTDMFAQGYFVYDSKKAGAMTVSHLRFDRTPIRSSYLVKQASFVACHQFEFVEKIDPLEHAAPGATFLLNTPFPPEQVWENLPREMQQAIIDKNAQFHVVDAAAIAQQCGLGNRINTVMQTCFFALTGLMPVEQAKQLVKQAIEKTYLRRGQAIVERNQRAVDLAVDSVSHVSVPTGITSLVGRPPIVPEAAPDFVQRVSAMMLAGKGDMLPVSAFPADGTWPVATSQWEKRNIAKEIPAWQPEICTECNQCVIACPHAAIRAKVFAAEHLDQAPQGFLSKDNRTRDFRGLKYSLQVAPEDCTGCNLCVEVCPAKDRSNPRFKAINMVPQRPLREREIANYDFFLSLPEIGADQLDKFDARTTQLLQPLFEYSGACSGCGETPYIKLLTQLFGDRMMIANATGCSSIYGGNLPTTPYATNPDGRGPTWSNSLFEDNAEFGLGFRLAVEAHQKRAGNLLLQLEASLPPELVASLQAPIGSSAEAVGARRAQIQQLKDLLSHIDNASAEQLAQCADYLVDKSIWLVGGDGWAYDIGFGGLDQVLSMTHNVNVLVMDTQCYSNTGGQQSKATPLGASAKFATSGKGVDRKDLGLEMMMLGHVYVAQIALGASLNQTVKALREAEAYPGPSIVIAYSPCVAHGFDLAKGHEQQKRLTESGMWPLFRFDPRRIGQGKQPFQLDSKRFKGKARDVMLDEARFKVVERMDPQAFEAYLDRAEINAKRRIELYQQLSQVQFADQDREQEE